MSRKTKAKATVSRRTTSGAQAVQVDQSDGSRTAIFENLRVLITKSDGSWLAQGLEVDYAVDGESLQDVKRRFEQGLAMTIESNLRIHGSITPLLQVAPQEVWDQWNEVRNTLRRFKLTTVIMTPQTQSELPYDNIVWLDASKAEGVA